MGAWSIKLTFSLTITFYVTKIENKTKKYLTQLKGAPKRPTLIRVNEYLSKIIFFNIEYIIIWPEISIIFL